ncbi:hypothetical protein [Acetobacter conturbans]|uniref:Uncharacterized protein n=1 Tax=Acetobacter conturbans TaxID=1737472 RepID=A0ABX0K443_9PROT|nr:hypothetical protein [Acetobacter conturbans]NHN89088.1 hypothetical protein [Acetobacter conturbans]
MSDPVVKTTLDGDNLMPEHGIDPRQFASQNASAPIANQLSSANSSVSDPTVSSTPVKVITSPGAHFQMVFAEQGDITYDVTPDQSLDLTLTGGTSNMLQNLTLVLRQPSTAGFAVSLPPAHYQDGAPPAVNTNAGTATIISYLTDDGGKTIYGGL